MTLVFDASAIVAALLGSGAEGEWAESLVRSEEIIAPHLMPVEAASILRRAAFAGEIASEVASMAHGDLLQLRVDLAPYEPFAERAWELRETVTAYDAWYVALAESLGVGLATLDLRLSRAPGPVCRFVTPSGL